MSIAQRKIYNKGGEIMLIGYSETGKIIFIKDGIIKNYNPTATEDEKIGVITKDVAITLDLDNYSYDDYLCTHMYDGEKITDCEDQRQPLKDELETKIANTINAMVLNVLPEGETLTPDNVPSLLDIVNPATPEESGTLENPIVIEDDDIAHNGYLYTYGKYYLWNHILYKCQRTGESDGGTIKLYYTPDQLIGQYFVTV